MEGWKGGGMDGGMEERRDGGMDGGMFGVMDGGVERWMEVWMNRGMEGWMEGEAGAPGKVSKCCLTLLLPEDEEKLNPCPCCPCQQPLLGHIMVPLSCKTG